MTPQFSTRVKETGIYEILNTANGKRYIGSSKDINNRLRQHRSALRSGRHHSFHLQRAWGNVGETGFQFKPIVICAAPDLAFYEQLIIDGYESANRKFGYNICPEVGTTANKPVRPETIENMRAAALRRIRNPRKPYVKKTPEEEFDNRSKGQRGRTFSSTHKEKLSAAHLGVKLPHMGAHMRAKTHCPQGHPYAGANLRIGKQKSGNLRSCRQCARDKMRARRERQRIGGGEK